MLLKLYLYGYLHRIRSSRLLEAECQRNVEVIWLTGKQAPDHKTIADFRKDNAQPFQAVHRQFRLLCHKLNLFGAQLVGLDGTKLAAVNSKEANRGCVETQPNLRRWQTPYGHRIVFVVKTGKIAGEKINGVVDVWRSGFSIKGASYRPAKRCASKCIANGF